MTIVKLFGLLCIVALTTCTNKKLKTTISLTSLKRATLDTSSSAQTLLKIIRTYPAIMDCDEKEKYANLYVCTKWSTGDTTYVFENCREVDKYALDTSRGYPIVIDESNLNIQYPTNVTVFIPDNFKIPTDSKYFFSDAVGYLTEY
jgi:hypothetical protein